MRLTACRLRGWWVTLLGLSLAPPAALPAQADHPDAGLTRALGELTRGFRGDVGIYVRDLRTGRTAALRADERFPTASMIKVPIMVSIFEAIANGQLGYLDTAPPPRPTARDPGGDLVAGLSDTARVEVGRLLTLSLTFSDNTASLWLQQLAGGGAGVNRWLEGHGFDSTRVNARTAGREAEYEAYGWGQTTPREMARLVTQIREGKVVSRAASEEMYRTVTRSYWTGEALSQIPPTVQAASKPRCRTVVESAAVRENVMSALERLMGDAVQVVAWAQVPRF